jgi:hypothetical protein
MISEQELERRLELACQHRELEPAFLRCLLDAPLYAHAPISDDHPRLRLIQFRHPDGFHALPIFTSRAKALRAAGTTARLVQLSGRELFESTPRATFMLNPNDRGCVLYPEEIAALLEKGVVARVENVHLEADTPIQIREATPPAWLIPTLQALYVGLPFVEAAYLLEVAPAERPEQRTFLVAIGVVREHAERAARATITMLQSTVAMADLPLDLTTFDPARDLPNYLCHPGAERFFGPRK